MVRIQDLARLGTLIAATQGWNAAKTFKAYVPSDHDKAVIATRAIELIRAFPPVPRASAMMSAAFAAHLERGLDAPVQVVAGTLRVEGEAVLGDGRPFDGPSVFGAGGFDWDGHVWVMVGPHVADISLFRMAYSADCPPRLGRHVVHSFGDGQSLYFDAWRKTRHMGLSYDPLYVLSEDEVTTLVGRAHRVIAAARSGEGPSDPAIFA